jgi:hypothetical protein
MELSAVAIMANNVGCVCQNARVGEVAGVSDNASATAGGMTAVLMEEERRREEERRQQQARQQQTQ